MIKSQDLKVFDPNNLFWVMRNFIIENKDKINPATGEKQRIEIYNEGGSRSGKSFDAYDLLIYYCNLAAHKKKKLSIYVVRKTQKSAREIAYQEDFVTKLTLAGLYDPYFSRNENQSPEFRLWGSTIQFIGLDTNEELGMSDIIYFNEALDLNDESKLNDQTLRCKILTIYDWNPKYTDHFLFQRQGRFNTLFTKTTFRDNKHLDSVMRGSILSTCPWDFDDYDEEKREWKVPKDQRRPNTINIKNGTANERRWLVYGDGERCPEDGAVFTNITWIKDFPDELDEIHFGLDFGYTSDPTVLVKIGRNDTNAYIQYLTYTPFDNSQAMFDCIIPILLEELESRMRKAQGREFQKIIVVCDSADRFKDIYFVRDLNALVLKNRIRHIQFVKIKKPTITVRLNLMKRFKLHVVNTASALKEFSNYVYMMIEGRKTNIPIDKHNHGIDATSYGFYYFWQWVFNNK